jgi:hypothetical protein
VKAIIRSTEKWKMVQVVPDTKKWKMVGMQTIPNSLLGGLWLAALCELVILPMVLAHK